MTNLRDEARWLIGEISDAKRLAKAVGKPQLANSAIEAGRIEEYDADGSLMQIVGEQHDGTHVPVTVNGPVPPEPVPPVMTVGASGVEGRWSGKFVGDMLSPMDFSHVALHASRVEVFTPSNETQLATITGELGDVATKILDAGEWTFGLVAVSKAGKWSDMSETVTLDVPDFSGGTEGVLDALLGLGSAVNGKITVDTKPPTEADGEGKPADALWNELDPVTREQVAVWRWTGTVWESLPLSETIIPKINIAEGTYGRLRGVQLEADAIDGMTITGGTVQTDRATDIGMKLDNSGLRAYGANGGEPLAEIRPDGGTVYQVSDPATGEVLGGIDSEGGVSGTGLAVSGEARVDGVLVTGGDPLTEIALGGNDPGKYGPVHNGRALLGTNFQSHLNIHPSTDERTAWFEAVPFGVIANGWLDSPASWGWQGLGEQPHYRILMVVSATLVAGRGYTISYQTPGFEQTNQLSALTPDRSVGAAFVRYSEPGGGISANSSGSVLPGTLHYIPGGGTNTKISGERYIRCPEDINPGKIMFGIEVFCYANRSMISATNRNSNRWQIIVSDSGPRRASNDYVASGSSQQGTEAPPPPLPPAPDPVREYVDTINSTWWQAYTGDNTQATHSTYAGSAAQGRTPYAPGNGVMRGLIGFPSQASRLSGATVKKIEVYVYAKSWHASAGGTAVLGVHGHGSKPGSWSAITNDVKRQKMKRPEGRWITLPSSVHNGFKLGNLTGISFYPPGGSTSTEYYGLFTGNKTKLRITYTK